MPALGVEGTAATLEDFDLLSAAAAVDGVEALSVTMLLLYFVCFELCFVAL